MNEGVVQKCKDCFAEINQLLQEYQEYQNRIENNKKEEAGYQNFRGEMVKRYSEKYGEVPPGESRKYSEEELRAIRMEFADTTFATILKRFFGFEKSRKETYFDLVGKLHGLIAYLQNQTLEYEQISQRCLEKTYALIKVYYQDFMEVRANSGCLQDADWDEYHMADIVKGKLYLGDIFAPLSAEWPKKLPVPGIVYHNGCLRMPITNTVDDPFSIQYTYRKMDKVQAIQAVHQLILQMVRLSTEYFAQFHFYDASSAGTEFGELRRLCEVKKQDVSYLNPRLTRGRYELARLYADDRTISSGLERLDHWMTAVAQELGQFDSVTEYNRGNSDGVTIPYQVVVLNDFPKGFNDQDIHVIDRMITNGKTLGVYVFLLNSQDQWDELNSKNIHKQESLETVLSQDAQNAMYQCDIQNQAACFLEGGTVYGCELQRLKDDRTEYIASIVATLNQERKQDNLFQSLFDIEESFGQFDSTDGLHVPFAITDKGTILEYFLGSAMNAHGLICGGTGSGKSTLLHMLISSMVMNYSPDDLEIWLSDYKITEFASYKTNTPPHIRFIGLSKTADFSYAFIDKIIAEMTRRQNIIAEADYVYKNNGGKDNITSFTDYRKVHGTFSMRRLIIIIDEFHVMSQHAQAEPDYKIKLENILAEARALGIIMLFSDQAIVDGLRGLSDKGKKQIKARIALSNYKDELKETLGEADEEKLRSYVIMKTGEVAIQTVRLNEYKEEIPDVVRGKGIYINGAWRYKVNEKARKVYHATEYVADIFDDRVIEEMSLADIAQWENAQPPQHRDGTRDIEIFLGKPVDLQFAMSFPLLRRGGNNIMSVSGSESEQMRILQSVIRSFQRQENHQIILLCDRYAGVYREYLPELEEMQEDDPTIEIYDELPDICYQVNRILGIVNNRDNEKKVLVIWLGLDAMADVFSGESSKKSKRLKDLANGGIPEASTADAKKEEKPETNGFFGFGMPEKEDTEENPLGDSKAVEKDPFEDAFDSLFGEGNGFSMDDDEDVSFSFGEDPEETEEEVYEEENYEDLAGEMKEVNVEVYDAREDVGRIVHVGPGRNVFNFVIYDTATTIRDFREVKTSDFKHKIAFSMSDNEAADFLDRSSMIRELPQNMAFYYNGRAGRRFIPYQL